MPLSTFKDFGAWTAEIPCPPWMPVYDFRAFTDRTYAECGYSSTPMEASYFQAMHLRELQALIEICRACEMVDGGPYRIRGLDAEIDRVLARNAQDGAPTYTRLLELLVQDGILVLRDRKD
jgi:hypothetical protein